MSRSTQFAMIFLLLLGAEIIGNAQVLRLAEMNSRQIAALDRSKTVILMPGGVMEQHGPYLPSFADGYMNEWWTERLAEAIVKRPGWKAVIFPMIPLGDGGANEIGFKYVFPGTYGVRIKTLRAVYMDLGTELGEQGFKWIFVIQNHGSPMHNLALDHGSDYFRDHYEGEMVNLFGLVFADSADPDLPEGQRRENGIDIHAGTSETSRLVFLKPGLVDNSYRRAQPITVIDPQKFSSIAMNNEWPGYFGSPRLATKEFGRKLMESRLSTAARIMQEILDGVDVNKFPRYADEAMKREAEIAERAIEYDNKVEKRQMDWLRKHGLE